MKKVFSGAKETYPDISRGGHRNPYQLKNAIKSGGTVYLQISLGLNSLPGSCGLMKIHGNHFTWNSCRQLQKMKSMKASIKHDMLLLFKK